MQLISELNVKKNELESTRKMTKSFKQTEERSNKKINELQQRYDMVKEEKETQAEGFDKRLNTLIRNFVKEFNRLGDNYLQYKDFVKHELDILYLVIEEKNKEITKREDDLGEYKLALRIPRQHYKHIEKLRFEEIKKQRDEIVIKLKKKYGIDPTKQMAQLKAPDPSLPAEQQFEMLTDGALVQQLAGKAPEPASKV